MITPTKSFICFFFVALALITFDWRSNKRHKKLLKSNFRKTYRRYTRFDLMRASCISTCFGFISIVLSKNDFVRSISVYRGLSSPVYLQIKKVGSFRLMRTLQLELFLANLKSCLSKNIFNLSAFVFLCSVEK